MSESEVSPRPRADQAADGAKPALDERTPHEIHMAELIDKHPRPASFEVNKRGQNPEERANIFSVWTLHYLTRLVSLGSKRPLVEADVWDVSKQHDCFYVSPDLEADWTRRISEANAFNATHGHPLVGVEDEPVISPTGTSAPQTPVSPGFAGASSPIATPESGSPPPDGGADTTETNSGAVPPPVAGRKNGGKVPPRRIPSLFGALCSLVPGGIVKMLILQALVRTEQIYESVVLGYLLTWLVVDIPLPGFEPEDKYWGYIYGVGLMLMYLGQNVCNNRYMSIGFDIFATVRSAINGLVYTKAIKIASVDSVNNAKKDDEAEEGSTAKAGSNSMGSGQVVNLVSVDSDKVGMIFYMGLNVILIPPQIAAIIYFIYEQVGVAIFAGLGVLIVVLPIILCTMICLGSLFVRRSAIGDTRVKLTNELLQGIRIVKFYAWEYFFEKKIAEIRDKEVDVLFNGFLTQMAMTFFFSISGSLLAVVTFAVYSAMEDEMPPVKIFRTLTLINTLQLPLFQLPASLNSIMQGLISIQRITQFLLLPELKTMQSLTSEGPLMAQNADAAAARVAIISRNLAADPEAIEAAAANAAAARMALASSAPAPEVGDEVAGSTVLARDSEFIYELENCAFAWEVPTLAPAPAAGGAGKTGTASRGDAASSSNSNAATSATASSAPVTSASRLKRVRVLADVTVKVPRGKITAIVGPVGCGKTSLVSGLLGELTKTHGRVSKDVSASVAYVAQSAWIQTMSIRKNILFGGELTSEADEVRYERTIDVCALRPDLETLETGDLTEIGDRGINLSGGQKQRVSIARAVYADAETIIFDDPLSAVDAHVAEHIFTHCIEGELADRTRILVTNQLHFLSRCDHIIVMGHRVDEEAAADAAVDAAAAAASQAAALASAIDPNPSAAASIPPASVPVALVPGTTSASIRQLGYIAEQGTFTTLFAEGTILPGLLQQYYSSLEQRGDGAGAPSVSALAEAVAAGADALSEMGGFPGDGPISSRLAQPTRTLNAQEKNELARTMLRRAASTASVLSRRLSFSQSRGTCLSPSRTRALSPRTCMSPSAGRAGRRGGPAFFRPDCASPSAKRGGNSAFFDRNLSALPSAPVGISEESSDDDDDEERELELAAANPAMGAQMARTIAFKTAEQNALDNSAKPKHQTHIGGQLRKGQQIADEELNTGSVSWWAYVYHLRTMGPLPLVAALLLTTAVAEGAQALMPVWLSWWSDNTFNHRMNWYLHIYLSLLGALAFLTLLRGFSFAFGNVNSSRYYHQRLVRIVLRAKSVFFDTTPVGRIINRFSKDMDTIDTIIPLMLQQLLVLIFGLLASVITVCIIIPYFSIGLVIVLVLFFFLHQYCSPVAVQLQRLESNTRSPLFQHFNETIKGMSTIRAFRKVPDFQRENFALNNVNTNTLFLTRQVYRWGALRIGILQSLMLLAAVLIIVNTRGDLAVGLAGSALTYLLSIGSTTGFLIIMMIELASRMNSIERIKFFMYETESEASLETLKKEVEPPAEWPKLGEIEYKNVEMRYRPELPLVLNGLSFKIKPGTKVGVVGRTGSGKSSLMMLLMRLYEIESGQILIDGVDIRTLGLHRLRNSIGIVPQDAVMFSGTLRENLDPFGQFTDEELFDALDQVSLREYTLALGDALDHPVKEFGSNFSVGQRQLICMARVLLKKPRVLLLDEATSSVDSETDALLQQAIQRRFADCTVLTIAHRLNTVMHSDAIMVLDGGTLAEFGSPRELLRGTGLWEGDEADLTVEPGLFAKMYQAYLANNKDRDIDLDAVADDASIATVAAVAAVAAAAAAAAAAAEKASMKSDK